MLHGWLPMNFSDTVAIIGVLTSLVGIPITFIVARRARQRPELRYSTDFEVLLAPSDSLFDQGLSMTLGSQEIDRISRTRIGVWNNRGDTIQKSDILDTDPLQLVLNGDDRVLQTRVVSASRKQIALKSTISPEANSSVLIDFDFLDASDGGVIEVIHQGLKRPTMSGTLRGSTIISNGSAKLDPNVLAAIASKSLPYRTWKFLVQHIGTLFLTLFWTTIIVYAFITGLIIPIFFSKPDRLINPNHYNLETAAGQSKFVNAVSDTHYYAFSSGAYAFLYSHKTFFLALIICAILLVVILGSYAIYVIAKRRIPVRIALYRDPSTIVEPPNSSSEHQASPPGTYE